MIDRKADVLGEVRVMMFGEIKAMMLDTLLSIMRNETSETRDRLKAVELLEKILVTERTLKEVKEQT